MRVLLDECLPRRLAPDLSGHEVVTVPQAGWAGISNAKLLARIAGRFDAFFTIDQNLPAQQHTSTLPFGLIVRRARSNQPIALHPLAPQILAALQHLQPGEVVQIPAP